MQISSFSWLNIFALFDHFKTSQSHIYMYSNLQAAQYNNELLNTHTERPAVIDEGVESVSRSQADWDTN